jgi:hypothetical protein
VNTGSGPDTLTRPVSDGAGAGSSPPIGRSITPRAILQRRKSILVVADDVVCKRCPVPILNVCIGEAGVALHAAVHPVIALAVKASSVRPSRRKGIPFHAYN